MFSTAPTPRTDFADTRAFAAEPGRSASFFGRPDAADTTELLASADAADLHLLRLVGCAALATLLLALATGLSV
ncbi:MAG: hypothetical protein Q8K45_02830 [Rubrivivax sp.]|nr:hypothetical protein [Rubrivivax sp.]